MVDAPPPARVTTGPASRGTPAAPMVLRDSLPADYRHVLARPEGFERTLPTIVIEGVEELVEALRAA